MPILINEVSPTPLMNSDPMFLEIIGAMGEDRDWVTMLASMNSSSALAKGFSFQPGVHIFQAVNTLTGGSP